MRREGEKRKVSCPFDMTAAHRVRLGDVSPVLEDEDVVGEMLSSILGRVDKL